MEHTQIPWMEHISYFGKVFVARDMGEAEKLPPLICYIGDMEETDGEDHANAEFIVRAVNCHDELLAVCEELEGYVYHEAGGEGCDRLKACKRAWAVIAKAKGEDT